MRWFAVLCVAAAFTSPVRADCDGCLDGWCYTKHRLPANSAGNTGDIDRNTNTLYVTKYPSEDRIRQCNLDTGTCNEYEVKDIRKIVVDQRTGEIYGNSFWREGIYRFDLANNKEHLLVSDVKTWNMQFKDKLYYAVARTGTGGIFKYDNGVSRMVPGTSGFDVASFVVDNNNDIYFDAGVTSIATRRLSHGVVHHDGYLDTISFPTVDKDNNVIFINHTYSDLPSTVSTYFYRKINGQLVEVGAINDYTYGRPLFDRDNNLVYTFSGIDPYIHLKKENAVQCVIDDNKIKIRARTAP